MRGSGPMYRRLGSLACVVGVVAALMVAPSPGLVRGEAQQEFATKEECETTLGVACRKTERGTWAVTLSSLPENDGPGFTWDPFADTEWIHQNSLLMQEGVSGEPLHPVVALDMKKLIFPDALPWINPETNRTMLPVRYVAQALGATVNWDQATQMATITRKATVITLVVNENVAHVNGEKVQLDAPLMLVPPGRILAPIRFITETFGLKVDWIAREPPPNSTGWTGQYQVWLWDPDGYWGPYTIDDRLVAGWWLLRKKEVTDILTFCRGETVKGDQYTHWTPPDSLRPQCGDLTRRFAEVTP